MDYKRPLTPEFLNRIDRRLLKNSPVTWSTRIHLACYYLLAFALLVLALSFIAPDDPRNESTIHNWIILLGIVSLLAFVFWMIYLLRFNVFKRFGQWKGTDTAKTFILYFLVILLVVSVPYIPPVVQSIRANASYTSDELARDINAMNTKLCLLERDSIPTKFSRDTFMLKDSVQGSVVRNFVDDENIEGRVSDYYFVDSVTLNSKLHLADSIRKLNDSVYVVFQCPDYSFINTHDINDYSTIKILGSMDIFRLVLQQPKVIDTIKTKKELAALFAKYSQWHDNGELRVDYDHYDYNFEPGYPGRLVNKYNLYYVNSTLSNIAEKKYRWDNETIAVAWRAAYYTSLILALLVLIYRHTTRRTFFLSLLTAVILSILTGMFLAMATSENAFFTWVIFYFILFASLSFTIVGSKQRNVFSGIALNLLIFITPFMPLIATATYYNYLHDKYDYQNRLGIYDHLFKNEAQHYFMAETGGLLLVLILFATLYQQAYRRWYALPEQ